MLSISRTVFVIERLSKYNWRVVVVSFFMISVKTWLGDETQDDTIEITPSKAHRVNQIAPRTPSPSWSPQSHVHQRQGTKWAYKPTRHEFTIAPNTIAYATSWFLLDEIVTDFNFLESSSKSFLQPHKETYMTCIDPESSCEMPNKPLGQIWR